MIHTISFPNFTDSKSRSYFSEAQNHCVNRNLVNFKFLVTMVNLKGKKSIASLVGQAKAKMQTCLLEKCLKLQNKKFIFNILLQILV